MDNFNLIESNQILQTPDIDDIQKIISGLMGVVVTIGVNTRMMPLKMVTFFGKGSSTEDAVLGHHKAIAESYEWAMYKPFAFSLMTGKPVCSNPNKFKAVIIKPLKGVSVFGDIIDQTYRWERWTYHN